MVLPAVASRPIKNVSPKKELPPAEAADRAQHKNRPVVGAEQRGKVKQAINVERLKPTPDSRGQVDMTNDTTNSVAMLDRMYSQPELNTGDGTKAADAMKRLFEDGRPVVIAASGADTPSAASPSNNSQGSHHNWSSQNKTTTANQRANSVQRIAHEAATPTTSPNQGVRNTVLGRASTGRARVGALGSNLSELPPSAY